MKQSARCRRLARTRHGTARNERCTVAGYERLAAVAARCPVRWRAGAPALRYTARRAGTPPYVAVARDTVTLNIKMESERTDEIIRISPKAVTMRSPDSGAVNRRAVPGLRALALREPRRRCPRPRPSASLSSHSWATGCNVCPEMPCRPRARRADRLSHDTQPCTQLYIIHSCIQLQYSIDHHHHHRAQSRPRRCPC